MIVEKAILAEASSLAEHWRKLYARTGQTIYLRTAEVLGTLRAAVIDKPTLNENNQKQEPTPSG